MKEQIFDYIDTHQKELIQLIQEILKLPSVKKEALPNYPFGQDIGLCLETVLSKAKEMGFHTVNLDGYVAYAEYGQGEEYIGIVGHLDVVPEGDGWTYPPYGAEIHNGVLYGRGVLDNKSPILSCLFAVKTLMDLQVKSNYRVRIIFGTDEESGFHDIPYYLNKEKAPLMGFTPDCKYPVVYGENGVLRASISQKTYSDKAILLKKINGDFLSSVVPDFCEFVFELSDPTMDITSLEYLSQQKNITISREHNLLKIAYKGVRAPANNPYLGDNAIIGLLGILPTNFLQNTNIEHFTQQITSSLQDIYGSGLEINFHDDHTGDLMITVYDLYLEDDSLSLKMTLRYPINCPIDDRLNTLKNTFKTSEFQIITHMPAVNFPLDHPMIVELSKAYEEITHLNSDPVTTTGGTYAKVMPNIVAFGPSFPGERGIAHNSDEYMAIDHIILNTKIYAYAIYRLTQCTIK